MMFEESSNYPTTAYAVKIVSAFCIRLSRRGKGGHKGVIQSNNILTEKIYFSLKVNVSAKVFGLTP